jgi:hypothetical protein
MASVGACGIPTVSVGNSIRVRVSRVLADLAQQRWADVAPGMKWHCSGSSVSMAVELVRSRARSTLKTEKQRDAFDLGCGESRYSGPHRLSHHQCRCSDELALRLQGALRLQKCNDFCKVGTHLFNGFALGMRALNSRNTAHE